MRALSIAMTHLVRSPGWARTAGIVAAVMTAGYIGAVLLAPFEADDFWGLVFGWIAVVLMLAVAFYAVRRRTLARAPGRVRTWLLIHLYGGLLFTLAFLFHTGFHLPHGAMNWLLWVLSLWVSITGVLGVLLQKWIPGALASALTVEVLYERIPELVDDVRRNAETTAGGSSTLVADFYRRTVADDLRLPRFRPLFFVDVTGGIQARLRSFDFLDGVLDGPDAAAVTRLRELYRAKMELDAHYTLQRVLRVWLWSHVPASVVLLVLVALHVWVWFYY